MQPGSCRAQTLHFGDSGGRRSPAWLWGPGCWVEPAGQELCQDAGFSPAESCPGHPRLSARVCPGEPVALWRHVPSPQGVPEDRGRRWALRDPWGLQGHLPLGGQVGRSPPTGGKAKVRGTPRSHPLPRLGARGRIPGRGSGPQGSPSAGSSDEACPGPAETRTLLGGGHSTAHTPPSGHLSQPQLLSAEITVTADALSSYLPKQSGVTVRGPGEGLFLPKPQEVSEWTMRALAGAPGARETHRVYQTRRAQVPPHPMSPRYRWGGLGADKEEARGAGQGQHGAMARAQRATLVPSAEPSSDLWFPGAAAGRLRGRPQWKRASQDKETHGSLTPQPPGSTSGALSLRGAPSLKGWEGIPGPGQAAARLGSGAVSAAPPSLPGTCHPS